MMALSCIIGGFFLMTPQNDRVWEPNVERLAHYRFVDGQVEIYNVRNFIWQDQDTYTTQWETRRYALENIQSVDLIVSHFIAGPVAHAFISFGFADGQHLAFSLEVRQEKEEGFSVLGGFFVNMNWRWWWAMKMTSSMRAVIFAMKRCIFIRFQYKPPTCKCCF